MDEQAEYVSVHERQILSTHPKSLCSSWAHHVISKIILVEELSLKLSCDMYVCFILLLSE